MTSGQCFKTIHSDHQTKWNAMVQQKCECHPIDENDTHCRIIISRLSMDFACIGNISTERCKMLLSPCVLCLGEREIMSLSVNHHYGPQGSVQCLGFLIRMWHEIRGSEDSGLQVMRGWATKPDWGKSRSGSTAGDWGETQYK